MTELRAITEDNFIDASGWRRGRRILFPTRSGASRRPMSTGTSASPSGSTRKEK